VPLVIEMKPKIKYTAASVLLLILSVCVIFFFSDIKNRIHLYLERDEIRLSAQRYFDSEMNRDFQNLYYCLAESSLYRRSHTYEDYLEDVENSCVRVVEYEIVGIYNLRENNDQNSYPEVEKFADVEVEVTLFCPSSGNTTQRNQRFTFMKEKGKWLKG